MKRRDIRKGARGRLTQRKKKARTAAKQRRTVSNYRRLLGIAGKLAETFSDADELESIFVLRRAATIIDDRRGLGGHVAKPDWSYQRGISRGCGSR